MMYGIEELKKRSDGYVFWKDINVEHYSFHDDDGAVKEREAAQDLAARCRHLESLGIEVRTGTAVWSWSWYENLTPELLSSLSPEAQSFFITRIGHSLYENADGQIAWIESEVPYEGDEYQRVATMTVHTPGKARGQFRILSDTLGGLFKPLRLAGWHTARMGQAEHQGIGYATTEQVIAFLKAKGV